MRLKHAMTIAVARCAVMLLIISVSCQKAPVPDKPNVVVILIDTLRSDHLGIYGREPETAPFLASLAQSSTVFNRAFSTSSWTAPSTASIFTSLYPHHHGVVQGLFAHNGHVKELEERGEATLPMNRLPDEISTLPEYLKSLGYATYGMASNPNITDEIGFTRGFDRFYQEYQAPVELFYKKLKSWKREMGRNRPYFLYLHLNDVHEPYEIRQPFYDAQLSHASGAKARYLGEIGYVDDYIRRIYKLLKLDRNTIVYFLSDHGEEFLDHGSYSHGAQLYRELNQVLTMVHAPDLGVEGGRVDVNVSHIDVFPTIVEMLGEQMPHEGQGQSLVPLLGLADEKEDLLRERLRDRTIFAHRIIPEHPERQHWAAIREHWKFIDHWHLEPELFDHRNDLLEKSNVIEKNQAIANTLEEQLSAFRESTPNFAYSLAEVTLDAELMEILSSQGYVE